MMRSTSLSAKDYTRAMREISLEQYIISRRPILDKEGKFIFFPTHKACMTSIQHVLRDRILTHKKHGKKYQKALRAAAAYPKGYYKFTVVRNPYDRTLSAYRYLSKIKRYRTLAEDRFRDFCVKGLVGYLGDAHFSHQHHNVMFQNSQFVDFVARFENIDTDWEIIANTIGCKASLPVKNASKKKVDYRDYYTDMSKKTVKKIYKNDLRILGYDF